MYILKDTAQKYFCKYKYEVSNMQRTSTEENTNELLANMYRNVKMGNESLTDVIPMIKDKFLLTNVTSQMEHYSDYASRTAAELRKRAVKPKELSAMKKAMAKSGIMMNTMFDSSDRHIAEMIEKGTRLGVDELENQLLSLADSGCDFAVAGLCREIINYERREADKMKDFE